MLKQIMIPMAALAVTVTSASAFTGSDWLSKADIDLTDAQVSALEEARQIKDTAQDSARTILEEAGIDAEKMKEIRDAMHEVRQVEHEAMQTAIENNDYVAFVTAISDSPLSEKITSQADFEKFVEAHTLLKNGDKDAAEVIFTELGIEKLSGDRGHGEGGKKGFGGPDSWGRQSAEAS